MNTYVKQSTFITKHIYYIYLLYYNFHACPLYLLTHTHTHTHTRARAHARTYIYMSEMKERRSSSLDSREYRNFVTWIKQMPLRLFEIYDHELGLEATISRRT